MDKEKLNNALPIDHLNLQWPELSITQSSFKEICSINASLNKESELNELFKKIAFIEEEMGRKRTYKNEPRTCDIDVNDFNQMVLDSEKICLPHPRTHERNFVLYPLQEINAQWTHPKSNKKIHTLIDNLSFDESNEITRLKERVILNK